jgi:hypothetical protein
MFRHVAFSVGTGVGGHIKQNISIVMNSSAFPFVAICATFMDGVSSQKRQWVSFEIPFLNYGNFSNLCLLATSALAQTRRNFLYSRRVGVANPSDCLILPGVVTLQESCLSIFVVSLRRYLASASAFAITFFHRSTITRQTEKV